MKTCSLAPVARLWQELAQILDSRQPTSNNPAMDDAHSSPPSFFSSIYPHVARPMASSSSTLAPASGYVCDTIPPAKLLAKAPPSRSPSPMPPPTPPVTAFEAPILASSSLGRKGKSPEVHHVPAVPAEPSQLAPPPGRKLCVRHQRMADEGTNLKLQQVSHSVIYCRSPLRWHRNILRFRKVVGIRHATGDGSGRHSRS
jgi:hypothetical protein